MYGMAAGGVISGIGALMAGQAQAGTLQYQAQIQRNNAILATRAAQADATRQGIVSGQKIGAIKAEYGASGVSSTSGSVLDVIGASAGNAELDAQNIIHGGEVRSLNYQNQASLETAAAGNALKSSYFNAIGSLVGSAGRIGANFAGAPTPPGGGSMVTDYSAAESLGPSASEVLDARNNDYGEVG